MRFFKLITTLVFLSLAPIGAGAAEQTVALKVNGMTCASCAYQVRRTLTALDGVTAAEVLVAEDKALVTFDDTKSDAAKMTAALTQAGYLSEVLGLQKAATTTQ
jgi:mercuric ion binding protein